MASTLYIIDSKPSENYFQALHETVDIETDKLAGPKRNGSVYTHSYVNHGQIGVLRA